LGLEKIRLVALTSQGIRLHGDEAVAIVLEVCDLSEHALYAAPVRGVPPFSAIAIDELGRVTADELVPADGGDAVVLLGRLLRALLPDRGGSDVPGALQLIAERAAGELEVSPPSSVVDLAKMLLRFDGGDRRAVIRRVFERARSSGLQDAGALQMRGGSVVAFVADMAEERPAVAPYLLRRFSWRRR
jgi:hypothetical protein